MPEVLEPEVENEELEDEVLEDENDDKPKRKSLADNNTFVFADGPNSTDYAAWKEFEQKIQDELGQSILYEDGTVHPKFRHRILH